MKSAIIKRCVCALTALLSLPILSGQAITHDAKTPFTTNPRARPIISPSVPVRQNAVCIISGVTAKIDIKNGVATTNLKIEIHNPNNVVTEAEMLIPVPDGVVVKGMDFAGKAPESTAKMMPKAEALRDYRQIVSQMRDPAIMEFVNYNMIRSAVFPVEARGKQMVSITYEQVLPKTANRIDYILPRSESLDYKIPWNIFLTLDVNNPKDVFSPSHKLVAGKKQADGKQSFMLDASSQLEPGAFMFSYTSDTNKPISFMYPDPRINGGYFMIVGNAEPSQKIDDKTNLNEVILVLDRSGSMRGKLIKQAKEAAKQLVASLEEGVYFNIIMYNEAVDPFSKTSVPKNEKTLEDAFKYIDSFNPGGGTNINDALVEALTKPVPASPATHPERVKSVVLFLTDGIPTIGQVRERTIRETAKAAAEKSNRRIFTFGVGSDVNAPLLDKIAQEAFGRSTYVLPDENIEVKIGQVASRISKKSFTDSTFAFAGAQGKNNLEMRGIFPRKFGDIYTGEQIIIIGEYRNTSDGTKAASVTAVLSCIDPGKADKAQSLELIRTVLDTSDATTVNAFVPRLYAARRIAELTDAVRDLGMDGVTNNADPKVKELVDEIVKLSIEYGILSDFTAFFAGEGSIDINAEASDADTFSSSIRSEAFEKTDMIQKERSGKMAVTSAFNNQLLKDAKESNRRNIQLDEVGMRMKAKSNMTMNQMDRQSFVRNGKQWTQGDVINSKRQSLKPDQTVEFGSKDYDTVIAELAKSNRLNALSLEGEILLDVNGKLVLVRNTVK